MRKAHRDLWLRDSGLSIELRLCFTSDSTGWTKDSGAGIMPKATAVMTTMSMRWIGTLLGKDQWTTRVG